MFVLPEFGVVEVVFSRSFLNPFNEEQQSREVFFDVLIRYKFYQRNHQDLKKENIRIINCLHAISTTGRNQDNIRQF